MREWKSNPLWLSRALSLVVFVPAVVGASVVSAPEDVCAHDDDPCVVRTLVTVDDFVDMDFGTRRLVIADGGILDLSRAVSFFDEFRCGSLQVEPGGRIALAARRGPDSDGGDAEIEVVGTCSDAPIQTCTEDADCASADCVGGDVVVAGRIVGRASRFTRLRIIAAGDVDIDGDVNLSSRGRGFRTAGALVVESGGSIRVGGRMRGRGGAAESGGDLWLTAAGSVRLDDLVADLRGGAVGGGTIHVEADQDVIVSGEFRMDASRSDGEGGRFEIEAGRDVLVAVGPDRPTTTFDLRGHRDSPSLFFAGDGGRFVVSAGRDATLQAGVLVNARGGNTGFGGTVSVEAGGSARMDALIDLLTPGRGSVGGSFVLSAGAGELRLGAAGSVVNGGLRQGGRNYLTGDGTMFVEGSILSRGEDSPGFIYVGGDSDLVVSGSLRTEATPALFSPGSTIILDACEISLLTGADVSTGAAGRDVNITVRGALVTARGSNLGGDSPVSSLQIIHRDPLLPPVFGGTVHPAPTISIDDTLVPCP